MNAFADVMFSLLLGWVRGFIGEVWGLVTSGAGEGFMSWIGDNWLWIVLILCMIGTALDYAVWLMRWRPYKVWRARIDAMRRKGHGESRRARKFNQGYQEGIQMDWLGQQDALEQDEYGQGYAQEEYDPRAAYVDGAFVGAQPAYDEAAYRPPVSQDEYAPAPEMPERRRRSNHRAANARRITGKLVRDDEDDRMIDGLPPLVDKDQAYHTPVYPGAPANASERRAPWEDNDGGN